MDWFLSRFLVLLLFATSNINGQQNYSGNSVMDCEEHEATAPSPAFLYACNGKPSCQAFLIYKSQPSYNTVSSISNLTSSDPSELARINNISSSVILPTDQELIVPVRCSCPGKYYQANTSYVIPSNSDTYFTIANNTYQGLSTCNSLMRENSYDEYGLDIGMELKVPLRCACPTVNQTKNGTEFLLTYLVSWGDEVPKISKRFNASLESVAYANEFSEAHPTVFPFTTILIPLTSEPSSSQTIIHHPPPAYLPPVNPNLTPKRLSKRSSVWMMVGIPLLVIFVVLSMILLIKKAHFGPQKVGKVKKKPSLPEDLIDRIASVEQGLKVHTYEELVVATEGFSIENRLSGSVYRGFISGELVAIKKMSKDVSNEVNLLRKINHFNLISLHAVCQHQEAFYLIYEFMENGTLRDWIKKQSFSEFQNWSRRIQIALDVANGLHYIHNFTYPPYVHKNVSSRNILLGTHFRAKISNFSLASLAEVEEYVNSSKRLAVEEKCYMAPEYIEYGWVTPKIDIYAFGVVLLELITGKEPVFTQNGREMELHEAVISTMEGEDLETENICLVDPSLAIDHQKELILRMLKLSLACLGEEPESRPTLDEIVSYLSKVQSDIHKSETVLNVFNV